MTPERASRGEPFEVPPLPQTRPRERAPSGDVAAALAAERAQRLLVSLHDAVRGALDPAHILYEIEARTARHFGVSRCSYGEVEPDGAHVSIARDYGLGVPSVAGRHVMDAFGPEVIRVLREGRTLAVADVRQDPRTSAAPVLAVYEAIEARAGLIVPLVKEGRFVAVFGLQHREPRPWAAEDVALAEQVAERTWFLLDAARAEADLRRANEQLSRADRRKDEFLATLAHELRNPLAPIRHALEVMRLRPLGDPALASAREVIERQVRQMTRLVDDLLDVSRITRGAVALRLERIDLAAVVDGAVEATRAAVADAGQRLEVALPPRPLLLDADPTRLIQALVNLVSNASKFTPAGGRIRISAEGRAGGRAAVTVADDGIGIRAEHLGRIFEMFSQVAPPLERERGGLGIGLALARGLVELHGGSIEARSEGPGKGAELTILLPLAAAGAGAPGAPPTPAPPPQADAAPAPAGRGRRVLVVDDNADAAEALALMLRLMGHEVHDARDGVAALERAAALRPDVVLLDIGLPRLNGYEAAKRLRAEPWGKSMLLIALTGWGRDEDRRRALEAGFDLHLTKPVEPEKLEEVLDR